MNMLFLVLEKTFRDYQIYPLIQNQFVLIEYLLAYLDVQQILLNSILFIPFILMNVQNCSLFNSVILFHLLVTVLDASAYIILT